MKRLKPDAEQERYAQFGRASLIPGIQHAIVVLQEMLDTLRGQLTEVQSALKPSRKQSFKGGPMGWSEDPEERKLQMAARRAVAKSKSKKKSRFENLIPAVKVISHPRNPDHPGHQAWLDKIQRSKNAAKRAKAAA